MTSLCKAGFHASLLALVLAPSLVAQGAEIGRPCAQQDSVGIIRPDDAAYRDAQAFRAFLTQHGFTVYCVIRSTFASFRWSAPEAAFFTNRGTMEVRFFPGPAGGERVQVEEEHTDSGWRYVFPPGTRASDTMYAGRRQYFIKSGRWLIMVDDPMVASTLRTAVRARYNTPGARGSLPDGAVVSGLRPARQEASFVRSGNCLLDSWPATANRSSHARGDS